MRYKNFNKNKKLLSNIYADGGQVDNNEDSKKSKIGAAQIATAAFSGLGNIINAFNNGANVSQSAVDDANNTLNSAISNYGSINTDSIDDFINSTSNMNNLDYVSSRDFKNGANVGNMINSTVGGASAGAAAGPWGALAGGVTGLGSAIFGDIAANKKATRLARNYNEAVDAINNSQNAAINNAADVTRNKIFNNMMANISAYGGPLTMRYTGNMSPFGNRFANGGSIYINPANEGKFNATKKRTGKTTEELTHSKNPLTRKRAIFAQNAEHWKHAFGGDLNTNGGDFSNGIIMIGNGGTHEENPMEGVQMGVDTEGTPNLVEQGEVVYNDYVFSNRIKVPNSLRDSLGLNKNKNLTFADAAKMVQKESKERPNDPISKRGLDNSMVKLQQAQEIVRQQRQKGNHYAYGGNLGTIFEGDGNVPQFLKKPDYSYNWEGIKVPDIYANIESVPDWNPLAGTSGEIKGYNVKVPYSPNTDTTITDNSTSTNKKVFDPTWLRYAPVIGSAIGLGQNLFSKPDYSSVNNVLNAANRVGSYTPVNFNPIGDYLTYKPFDINYTANQIKQQGNAQMRNIANLSGGNRAAAMAQQAAINYNTQTALSNAYRQAEEYNQAQREKVATFNRGTNQYNSEMGLKAAMANQSAAAQANAARFSGITQAMQLRDAINAQRASGIGANLSNFFNSLGDIGKEEYAKNMITSNPALYYSIDNKGNITYKNGYENLSEAEKATIRDAANKAKSNKKSKGGYLTIKKGGRCG